MTTDAQCAEYLRSCMRGVLSEFEKPEKASALENDKLREVLAMFREALK